MAKISWNVGESKTFWQEWNNDQPGEEAIVIGIDSGNTVYLQQKESSIVLSRWELKNFIKELKKLVE